MDWILKDARYALRSLLKTPGFTVVAVLTIALGIGANTAIFSVVRAVLLAPLPYQDADELVAVYGVLSARDVDDFPFSPGDYAALRDQSELFEDVAAASSFSVSLTGEGEPVQVMAGFVTYNLFDVLGVSPLVGRGFVAEDDLPNPPGAAPGGPGALPSVVILDHGLWQRRFGGDPAVIGRTMELGGVPSEVIGVMPPGFELLMPPGATLARDIEVWTTARIDYATAPANNVFLRPVARIRDGASIEQAQAEADRIVTGLAATNEVMASAGYGFRLAPLAGDVTESVRPILLALFGAVGFVLLIACANVSNLLLVRASGRGREFAVRAAMGGSRGRLVSQMLLESGMLAGLGAVFGVMLAALGMKALLALVPAELPRVENVGIDGYVLMFTLAAAAGAALVFGLAPAVQASKVNLADSLKDRGQSAAGSGTKMLRNVVVIGEVALSTVLLIGAGLMVRSFVELTRVEPGYDPAGAMVFSTALPFARYPQQEDREQVMTRLEEEIGAIPGVTAVTASVRIPLTGQGMNGRYGLEDALTDPSAFRQAAYEVVRANYFEAMGTPLLEGRTFTAADHADSTAVVVVGQNLARSLWPNESAVGKRFLVRVISPEPEWVEVIGVVAHQRSETLAADGMVQVYFTDRFFGTFATSWVVRAGLDPAGLAPAIRTAVGAVDPNLPVADLREFSTVVDEAMGPTRFALTLIGLFGVLALVLASVGLYGVLSYVVRQRSGEIGVRMAFGAQAESILGLVIRQGMGLAGLGLLLGLFAAYPLSSLMETMVVGVAPTDPVTFVSISGVFAAVAALACYLPARRATRVDPVRALREE